MGDPSRELTRQLYLEYADTNQPLQWFEALYTVAAGNRSLIPWADGRPNPNLVAWAESHRRPWPKLRACVVGCGLADDAEFLASLGAATTGFDLSPTAIAWAQQRFANQPNLTLEPQDLFDLPASFVGAFDFVFECYTLQAMPAKLRERGFGAVASLVAPGGELLLMSRARDVHEPEGNLPWPLTRQEIEGLRRYGLVVEEFRDFDDPYEPGKRRFLVLLRKP